MDSITVNDTPLLSQCAHMFFKCVVLLMLFMLTYIQWKRISASNLYLGCLSYKFSLLVNNKLCSAIWQKTWWFICICKLENMFRIILQRLTYTKTLSILTTTTMSLSYSFSNAFYVTEQISLQRLSMGC